jgi:hypothetical protein
MNMDYMIVENALMGDNTSHTYFLLLRFAHSAIFHPVHVFAHCAAKHRSRTQELQDNLNCMEDKKKNHTYCLDGIVELQALSSYDLFN